MFVTDLTVSTHSKEKGNSPKGELAGNINQTRLYCYARNGMEFQNKKSKTSLKRN